MKKMSKKILAFLLAAVMVFGAVPLSRFVGLEMPELTDIFGIKAEAVTSGTCGDNLTWNLKGQTLTISGIGAMYDYSGWKSSNPQPWTADMQRGAIQSVVIQEGVTRIGACAFEGLYNLRYVTIPRSVSEIDGSISSSQSVSVNYLGSIESWCYIDFAEGISFYNSTFYVNGKKVVELAIPETIEKIHNDSFHGFENYWSLTIPDGVKEIGKNAFSGCHFSNVSIGNTVETIGEYAFGSAKIVNLDLGKSVKIIGESVFENCESLKNVIIPDSVVEISASAFDGCEDLETVSVGSSVKSIGDNAFNGCYYLREILLPDGLENIGEATFKSCLKLRELSFGSSLKNIGSYAFESCSVLKSFYVSDDNPNFDADEYGVLFNEGKTLLIQCPADLQTDTYVIPDSVECIGAYGFDGCDGLKMLTIPSATSAIGESAFSGCKYLRDVYYLDAKEAWENIDIGEYNDNLFAARIHYLGGSFVFERKTILIGKNKNVKINGEIFTDLTDTSDYELTFTVSDNSGLTLVSDSWRKVDDESGTFSVTVKGLKDGEYTLKISDGMNEGTCKVVVGFSELQIETEDVKDNLWSLNGFFFNEDGNYYEGALDVLVKLTNKVKPEYESYDLFQKEIDSAAFNVKFVVEVNDGFSFDGVGTREKVFEYKPLELNKTKEPELKIFQEDESAQDLTITYKAFIDGELKHTDTETVTIKSYQELYVKEHIAALNDKDGYYYPLNDSFAQYMLPIENDYNYKWQKMMSDGLVGTISNLLHGDLDEKKAYDLVIADLINKIYSEKTVEEISLTIYSEEFTKLANSISKSAVEVAMSLPELNDQLDNIIIEDLTKVFTGDAPAEVVAFYKKLLTTEKGKNAMKAVVSKASKVDNCLFILDAAGIVIDSYNDYVKAVNAVAAMNTFAQMDAALIDVFFAMYGYCGDNQALKESIYSYLLYMNGNKQDRAIQIIKAYAEAGSVTATKVSFMTAKGIYMFTIKDVITKGVSSFLDVAGGVLTGIELGCYLSDALCNSTDYSVAASKVIASGKISIVLEKVVKELGKNVEATKSFSSAIILDRGLNLYREVEQYAYTNTIAALDAEANSKVYKTRDPLCNMLFADKKERYNTTISDLLVKNMKMNYLYCHDLQLEEIASQVTGLSASSSSFRKTAPKFKVVNVRCPVDVSVYDGTKLLVSFEGDEITYLADDISALAFYDEKYVCLPSTADYDVIITATENGKMKYSVEEFDENGASVREVLYEDIDLKKDHVFEGTIDDEPLTPAENYDLKTDGKVISDRKDSADGDIFDACEIKIIGDSDIDLNVPAQFNLLCSNLSENAKINWVCNDELVSIAQSADGLGCEIVSENEGDFVLTATVSGTGIKSDYDFSVSKKEYTLNWYIGKSVITETYSYGDKIVVPEVVIPEDRKFIRWSSEIPETMPSYDLSIMAVLERTKFTCEICGEEFNNESDYNDHMLYEDEKKNFSAVIAKPSVTTVSYGDSIILHAELTGNLPAGAFIEWSTDNGNFEKVASNDGMSCRLTPKSKGNTTVKLRVVSANGEVIAEDEQVMTSKAGFFDKIIGFFKSLFGLTKTIPQLIRKAF